MLHFSPQCPGSSFPCWFQLFYGFAIEAYMYFCLLTLSIVECCLLPAAFLFFVCFFPPCGQLDITNFKVLGRFLNYKWASYSCLGFWGPLPSFWKGLTWAPAVKCNWLTSINVIQTKITSFGVHSVKGFNENQPLHNVIFCLCHGISNIGICAGYNQN